MSKVVFLSFANTDFAPSLKRLQEQIKCCPLIDEFFFMTEKDLGADFLKDFHPSIYRRGYGYWKWKSYLVKRTFDKMNDGDVLIYSDAGCDYNPNAENRLREYIDIVRQHVSGVLCFEDPTLERQYTKGDVFTFLTGGNQQSQITDSNQRWAGMWLMCKCANSTNLVDKWWDTCESHFDLITDKASTSKNFPDFIEARHDQSVFSILTKQFGAYALPPEELAKANFANVPFQPTRNKMKSTKTFIYRRISLPFRWLIGLYLIAVQDFYFRGRYIW
ncbi:MAG: hypothetical protein SOY07_04710 [Bacteroidales bacterium]|nr:hypothetical protein [Bacteroidales bacterium]